MNEYTVTDTRTGARVGTFTDLPRALRVLRNLNAHAVTWQGDFNRYRLHTFTFGPSATRECQREWFDWRDLLA